MLNRELVLSKFKVPLSVLAQILHYIITLDIE